MGRVRGCRCRVVRCPLTPPWAGPAPPHVPRPSLEPPAPPPCRWKTGAEDEWAFEGKRGRRMMAIEEGARWICAGKQIYILLLLSGNEVGVEQVNICLPLRRCGPLGARETGGARYCFPREGGCFICFTFPRDSRCFICLTCLSAFPLLHVSSLPGGQICAMNKIAAKLRMKLHEIGMKNIWNHKRYCCRNGKYAIDLNWGWAAEILYIQPSEFALIDWAWEIQIISQPPSQTLKYSKISDGHLHAALT